MSSGDLSKMGTASVALNIIDGHRVIEKCPVGDVEYGFYQNAATELNHAGVATPKILYADSTRCKLRMEYIPHSVDQTDITKPEFVMMLGYLHRYPVNSEWLFHTHSWSDTALEKSLMLLALPEKNALQFRRFQQCSKALFSAKSLVSGDSNAGNWGRRDNGDLVLFDWERFGMASPAIDLAPLIKGMGTKQKFIELAEYYCQLTHCHRHLELSREIAIAKAWIVSEVIVLLNDRKKSIFPLYLNWYKEHLPGWINSIVKML